MKARKKLGLIVFSDELDKVHSAFTLACNAATVNYEVNMFFTYWGLNAISRCDSKSSQKKSWLNFKLSKYHFFGYGTALFQKLIKEHHVASLADLYKTAKALGVKLYACDTAIKIMGLPKQELKKYVEDIIRVSKMLEICENGQIIQI